MAVRFARECGTTRRKTPTLRPSRHSARVEQYTDGVRDARVDAPIGGEYNTLTLAGPGRVGEGGLACNPGVQGARRAMRRGFPAQVGISGRKLWHGVRK